MDVDWGALVVGGIVFKKQEEVEMLLGEVRKGLLGIVAEHSVLKEEVDGRNYYFAYLDWSGHLCVETVEELFNKIKDRVERFDVVLHYLYEGIIIYYDEREDEDGRRELCITYP